MKKITIQDMQKLATERGGKCLSTTYINNHSKLAWQCAEGHQWEAIPNSIKSGSWCPVCPHMKNTIEAMQKLAAERGGKCLSRTYLGSRSKLTWQCKRGHQWQTAPDNIRRRSWCPACGRSKKGTIEQMHEMAAQRGGKCLSKTYLNAHANLTWQCKHGHQWKAAPGNITRGSWCRTCAYNKRLLDFIETTS